MPILESSSCSPLCSSAWHFTPTGARCDTSLAPASRIDTIAVQLIVGKGAAPVAMLDPMRLGSPPQSGELGPAVEVPAS